MSNKTKIAVLVSGGGTNLQALIDAERRGEIPDGEITLVVGSRENIFALERAEKAGIEHVVVHKDEPKLISVLEAVGLSCISALTLCPALTAIMMRVTEGKKEGKGNYLLYQESLRGQLQRYI